MDKFLDENHRGSQILTLLNALNVQNVLNVPNMPIAQGRIVGLLGLVFW